VKVALSGDGGDELFGGYDRYRAIRLIDRLHRRLPVPGTLAGTIAKLLGGGHPKSHRARLARLADAMQHPPHEAYSRMTRLMSEEQIEALLAGTANPLKKIVSDRVADSVKTAGSMGDIVRAVMSTDRSQYLPGDLLTKVDRASMLHALEVRSPFMDHELVRFAAGLTTPQLLAGGPKRMLREAFSADLPASVFSRKKMGFAVPIGDWFRGELRSMLRDSLFASDSFATTHLNLAAVRQLVDEHEQSRVDHSQRLYALLMLELWWQSNH
jgi:asparagine synthase (glutamine-hydrolysing)